jgi:hypothetical protein
LLFNPDNQSNSNRPALFCNFLKSKIGEDKFDEVIKLLEGSDNPMRVLDEE